MFRQRKRLPNQVSNQVNLTDSMEKTMTNQMTTQEIRDYLRAPSTEEERQRLIREAMVVHSND